MAVTTLAEVAGALEVPATLPRLLVAWQSAEGYVAARCRWTPDAAGNPPAELVQAVILLTGRHLARYNSPDGIVGVADFGTARLPAQDADVRALIAPWRAMVFGG